MLSRGRTLEDSSSASEVRLAIREVKRGFRRSHRRGKETRRGTQPVSGQPAVVYGLPRGGVVLAVEVAVLSKPRWILLLSERLVIPSNPSMPLVLLLKMATR